MHLGLMSRHYVTFDNRYEKEVDLRKSSLDKSVAGTLCDSPTDSKFILSVYKAVLVLKCNQ